MKTEESKEAKDLLELKVSSDNMVVDVHISAPFPRDLQSQDIISLLNIHNIKFGFNQSKLLNEIHNYNKVRKKQKSYIIRAVEGTKPTESQDAYIELLIDESSHIQIDGANRADFRNIQKFKQIENNTILARRHLSKVGEEGYDVFGNQISPRTPQEPYLKCGENVIFDKKTNEYKATKKGIFNRDDNKISINQVLLIENDAGLASGNLIYEGSIYVKKNIERGTLISCTGDLDVDGFIETNLIKVGRNLNTKKGINAKTDNIIYIKNNLTATYIDNSEIAVLGHTFIERSINTSNLKLHGDLQMGERRSVLTGGSLYVFGSVSCNQIGNPSGTNTKIYIGWHDINHLMHNVYLEEIKKVNSKINKIENKIKKVKRFNEEKKIQEYNYTLEEAKQLIKRLEERVNQYAHNLYNSNKLKIVIRDVAYPGVEIHYKKYKELLKTPIHASILEFYPHEEKPRILPYNSK